jgi:hypothetical protein
MPLRKCTHYYYNLILIYLCSDEADEQVTGVPHQHRRKMTGRVPALAYYRQLHGLGQVMRLTEIPGPGRVHR